MGAPFLITGLPRSRTTWLSYAATLDGWSKCHHEASLDLDSIDALSKFYSSQPERYVGISDSHLAQILPLILEVIRPRTLIVLRNPQEVTQSLSKNGLSPRMIPACMQGIAATVGHDLVRTIDYADLFSSSEKVVEALQWLMPEAPISVDVIESLQGVKIEADHEANRRRYQESERRREALRRYPLEDRIRNAIHIQN